MPPVIIKRPPGFAPAVWERHKRDARRILWEQVLAEQLGIHHGYLAGQLGLYPFAGNYFSVLDAVCVDEVDAGGPMVTALVTAIGSEIPGGRFFTLAEKLEIEVKDRAEFALAQRQRSVAWIRVHPERASITAEDC